LKGLGVVFNSRSKHKTIYLPAEASAQAGPYKVFRCHRHFKKAQAELRGNQIKWL
jgi:hypothetical protein